MSTYFHFLTIYVYFSFRENNNYFNIKAIIYYSHYFIYYTHKNVYTATPFTQKKKKTHTT